MKRRFFTRSTLFAVLLYTILTIVMTWPLVTRMSHSMVGQVGDNIYFVWMIGWMKKALFDLGVNPFNIWFLNYPQGWNLAYTEITPLQLAIALPFSLTGNPIFAYNMALMLSFILAGLTMYLWVRDFSGKEYPALLAGMVYAFLPYHMAHFLIGHLNLMGIQWFPLFFWGLFDLLGLRGAHVNFEKHGSWWKSALLAGISLGLIGLTSQYFLYMTLIISVCIVICYLLFFARKRIFTIDFWKKMLVMGLFSLPLVLAAILPYLSLMQQGGLPDRDLEVVRRFSASASPLDFLLPSTDHFLWGGWIGDHFNRELWVECTLYIGFCAAILILIFAIKRKILNLYPLGWLLAIGAFVSFILALGPDLRWENEIFVVTLPELLKGILGRNRVHVPLPGLFLFKYFPLYAKLRAFARFGVFLLTFSSFAAGLGATWLFSKINLRWRPALFIFLTGLILLDFYPGVYTQFTVVQPRQVDIWLAEQPGDGALIQMPFVKGEDQEQIYYTLIHEKPFVGGFFNAFPPEQYQRVFPIMENFPDMGSVDLMRELGVQYVLVDVDEYENIEQVKSQCIDLGLQYIEQMDDQMIFILNLNQ